MYTTKIMLDSVEKIKNFVNIVNKYSFQIDLITPRYSVDAKSLMGIFSLEMGKPVDMKIHSRNYEPLLQEINDYIIKE